MISHLLRRTNQIESSQTKSGRAKPSRPLRPARLSAGDRLTLGFGAIRTRPLRSVLSACGIAVGIAAFVAVLGMATSQRADLMAQLDSLGTNLLTVTPGQGLFGATPVLPQEAPVMIGRIATVESSAAVHRVPGRVFRTEHIPTSQTGGLGVMAVDDTLLATLRGNLATGRWLDELPPGTPAVVLGARAAQRLGIHDIAEGTPGITIQVASHKFAVVGILEPLILAPGLDSQVFIDTEVARQLAATSDTPASDVVLNATTIFTRVTDGYIADTIPILAATANPRTPMDVAVSRPSDALAAQAMTDESLQALSLGLGAVGLGVGGVGIVNVMIIAVLERRREIGVRRALGATRRAIRGQFLGESVILAGMGGTLGAVLGVAVSIAYARSQGWAQSVPLTAIALGIGASLVIGAIAGAYPAMRAARVSPTQALRST